MSVLAYHPETQATVVVDDEALVHMRLSGWLTQAEHDANQAAAAEAAATAEQAKAAGKPAAQAAKTGQEK